MQFCDCLVFIGGDIGNSVMKKGISAPEIAVLRALHGADAVRNITVTSNDDVDQDNLRETLLLKYKDVVTNLFGRYGDLPKTLDAARVEKDMIVADLTKKPKPAKESASKETTISIGE
jgi:hypothetical protein